MLITLSSGKYFKTTKQIPNIYLHILDVPPHGVTWHTYNKGKRVPERDINAQECLIFFRVASKTRVAFIFRRIQRTFNALQPRDREALSRLSATLKSATNPNPVALCPYSFSKNHKGLRDRLRITIKKSAEKFQHSLERSTYPAIYL